MYFLKAMTLRFLFDRQKLCVLYDLNLLDNEDSDNDDDEGNLGGGARARDM